MVAKYLKQAICSGLLMAACAPSMLSYGADAPVEGMAARQLLADALTQQARSRWRDERIPPELAVREASVLLQAANLLDGSNTTTLQLMASAARSAKQPDVLRDALRQTIKVDSTNLVAQVQYLELLALASQKLDERAKIYEAALAKNTLDPQVRSEIAVRLARIELERGDAERGTALLKTALQLNDVNVTALQELVRLSPATPKSERLKNLVNLLTVNPYQPEAWLDVSSILSNSNLHSMAADCIIVALEQFRLDGKQVPGDMYLDLVVELATAGRRNETEGLVRGILAQPDAPMLALTASQAISLEYPIKEATTSPATQPTTAPATQPTKDLPTRLRDKMVAEVKADPKNEKLLAEALSTSAGMLPDPGPDFPQWLETYKSLVKPDDKVLARIEGWRLLNTGKPADAIKRLAAVAESDIASQIGIARAYVDLGDAEKAKKILQDIYNGHPSGLLGLLVAQTARKGAIQLTETTYSREMSDVYKSVSGSMSAHRQPRDLLLITAAQTKRRYSLGEPIMITVRQSNTTDRALPVGPNGVVRTSTGLTGSTRGLGAQSLGMFAVEDDFRTYRLERRGTLQYDVRADEGLLGDILQVNPIRTFTFALTMITEPRGNPKAFWMGLGGQAVSLGDGERTGITFRSPDEIYKLIKDMPTMPEQQRLSTARDLVILLSSLSPSEPTMQTLRRDLTTALLPYMSAKDPVVLAWMMEVMPMNGMPVEMIKAIDTPPTGGEGSPIFSNIARMVWAERIAATGDTVGGSIRASALDAVKKLSDNETDPLSKEWFDLLTKRLMQKGSTTAPGVKDPKVELQVGAATQSSGTRSDPRVTAPTSTQPKGPASP